MSQEKKSELMGATSGAASGLELLEIQNRGRNLKSKRPNHEICSLKRSLVAGRRHEG
jgi:hypothetical protein